MGEDPEQTKRGLRHAMRAARQRLSASEVARCSTVACERLLTLPCVAHARHVVAYSARNGEIDPALAVRAARQAGKSVYWPAGTGEFVASLPDDGARTPDGRLGADLDEVVFLVPGLAFDPRGARLGRGGGWYDGAFAHHRRGVRIGLAYDFQVVAELPEAPWDVRMHAVVTESRLLHQPADVWPGKEANSWT